MNLSVIFLVSLFGLVSTRSQPRVCKELQMAKCNVCHCGYCTWMGCPPGKKYADCVHDGNTYKHGDNFMNDCNQCVCNDGRPVCFQEDCSSPSKRTPIPQLPNKCWYGDKFVDVGTTVSDEGDCNACHCVGTGYKTGIACTLMGCSGPTVAPI